MSVENLDTVGFRIRKLRLENGLTIAQLSDGICTASALSQIESGKFKPKLTLLKQLADRLGVTVPFVTQETITDMEFNIEVVRMFLEVRDFNQAMLMLDQIDFGNATEHQFVLLTLYRAECLIFEGSLVAALADLEWLLAEREDVLIRRGLEYVVQLHNDMGNVFFMQRNWIKAYTSYRHAQRLLIDLPSGHYLVGNVFYNLGNACRENGFHTEALSYLQLAHESMILAKRQLHPHVVYSTALAYKDLGDFSKATELLKAARVLYQSENNALMSNRVSLHYLCDIVGNEDYATALNDLHELAAEFARNNDPVMVLLTYAKMISLALRHRDLQAAQKVRDLSVPFSSNVGQRDYLAYYHRAIAMLELEIGDLDACSEHVLRSIQLYRECGLVKEQAESMEVLADMHERMGLTDKVNSLLREMYSLVKTSGDRN